MHININITKWIYITILIFFFLQYLKENIIGKISIPLKLQKLGWEISKIETFIWKLKGRSQDNMDHGDGYKREVSCWKEWLSILKPKKHSDEEAQLYLFTAAFSNFIFQFRETAAVTAASYWKKDSHISITFTRERGFWV